MRDLDIARIFLHPGGEKTIKIQFFHIRLILWALLRYEISPRVVFQLDVYVLVNFASCGL